jgi:hypothetical protein
VNAYMRPLDGPTRQNSWNGQKKDAKGTLSSKVLAAEYRMALPDGKLIAADLRKTRRMLEHRSAPRTKR